MMSHAARTLALRRQLLVMQSQLRRLQLQHDVRELRALSSPLALFAHWTTAVKRPPWASLLAMVAVAAWRRWMNGRPG